MTRAILKYNIREATQQDVPALAKLFEMEAKLHLDLLPVYEMSADFDWQEYVNRKLGKRAQVIFVAETDSQIVGYIYLRVYPGKTNGSAKNRKARFWRKKQRAIGPVLARDAGVIENCFVLEEHRRKGVAKALFDNALTWFRHQGVRRIALGVLANNPPAVRFWEHCGFHPYRLLMHREL